VTAHNDNPRAAGGYVWIRADDTAGRRSRAAQARAERRRYELAHGVTLALVTRSYDEAPGFLHRSAFRYRITRA
jgi:hypothetical protein